MSSKQKTTNRCERCAEIEEAYGLLLKRYIQLEKLISRKPPVDIGDAEMNFFHHEQKADEVLF